MQLLVDVGLRSCSSFHCPTRSMRRDDSASDTAVGSLFQWLEQTAHRWIRSKSNVTPLCCWRRASGRPNMICVSSVYTCVLACHSKRHPATENNNNRLHSVRYLSVPTAIQVYQTLVLPVLTYACETLTLLPLPDIKRLEAFHIKCQRRITKICWLDHIRNP